MEINLYTLHHTPNYDKQIYPFFKLKVQRIFFLHSKQKIGIIKKAIKLKKKFTKTFFRGGGWEEYSAQIIANLPRTYEKLPCKGEPYGSVVVHTHRQTHLDTVTLL